MEKEKIIAPAVYEMMKHSELAAKIYAARLKDCGQQYSFETIIFDFLNITSTWAPDFYPIVLKNLKINIGNE